MTFTDILLIIIVLVIAGYGVFYYLKTQRGKEINELETKKDEILDIPISEQLFTLKNMELSGQTKRKYESLVATWQTITNFQFTEIEATLVGASQYVEQLNFVKSSRTIAEAQKLLADTAQQVQDLNQQLHDLIKLEEENAANNETLHERYNNARKNVMNHSFDYGPAIETLEKNLQYLELNFTKYNEFTNNGDYLEAQDMQKTIESEMSSLEEILERIPAMYDQIKNNYEDSLDDLRDGYQKMVTSRFNFDGMHVPETIDEIQERLNDAKNEIKNADLSEAQTIMDKAERDINHLYDVMETEVKSKEFVNKNIHQLRTQIDEVAENSRYAGIEVDRIAQSYILHENEVEQVAELASQLRTENGRFIELTKEYEASSVVYTKMESDIKKIKKRIEEINGYLIAIVERIGELNSREKEAKANLDSYELELRNIKRRIEKSHLPGLTEQYYNHFYLVTDQIEHFAKQLNRVRIDMNEIDELGTKLQNAMMKLMDMTESTLDNAMLTEYMIQQSNRYRYDFPEVDDAIKEAQFLFHREFKYGESLAVIEKALRRVDQEAPTQVRRMYHQEKTSRRF